MRGGRWNARDGLTGRDIIRGGWRWWWWCGEAMQRVHGKSGVKEREGAAPAVLMGGNGWLTFAEKSRV